VHGMPGAMALLPDLRDLEGKIERCKKAGC